MKKLNLKTEISMWLLMLVPLVYLAITWNELPDRVPTHFNLQGEANDWSSKTTLAAVVFFTTVGLYLLLLFLPKLDPKRRIESMGNTFHRLRFVMVLFMSGLMTYLIYNATSTDGLNPNLLLVLIGTLLAVLGNYFQAIKPNYFIGIRTPWTLESETIWRKTHRLAGPLWMAGGILFALLAFVQHGTWREVLGIVIIATLVLVPTVYSFLESKKEQKMKSNA
ncbi:SdpI family protein [Botryobacter ruber]|uniref:SdpI family protein n=1 Tax=Botryobacter ruber TaxID=2171629 RepID=UPI000E0B3CAD|nr:SdpI family protein [Botryobacter ruber]